MGTSPGALARHSASRSPFHWPRAKAARCTHHGRGARRTAAWCGLRRPGTRGHAGRRASPGAMRWPGACRHLRILRRPRELPGSRVTLRRSQCLDVDPETGKTLARPATVLCLQLTEQCLGFLEVGGIKSFREPAIDRHEELVSLSALALLLPQASKVHCSAQAVLRLGSDPRGDLVD